MKLPIMIPLKPWLKHMAEYHLLNELSKGSSVVGSVLLKKLRYGGDVLAIMSQSEIDYLKKSLDNSNIGKHHPGQLHVLAALRVLLTTALETSFEQPPLHDQETVQFH
jgi:hypothetical protein